ncbi:hypothetical protein ACWGRF_36965 [Streptomyces zhihengii]|uniref:hypothetical protein n=1 Tax=Streptomyces zhihengii TaxID=1818004 RepID=UPI003626E318
MTPTPPPEGPPGPLTPAPDGEAGSSVTPCGAPIYDALVRSWRDDRRSVPGQGRGAPARIGGPAARRAAPERTPCRDTGGTGRARRPSYEIRPFGVDLSRFSAG